MLIKEEISIRKVIVHILDPGIGMPVLSDSVLDFDSDLSDFLKEHLVKAVGGDDCKSCDFYKGESEIYQTLTEYREEDFIELSKNFAENIFEIMNNGSDIPSGDLFVIRFKHFDGEFLGILKMDYKEFFTHKTMSGDGANNNEIIKYKSILPTKSQKVSEGAVINLADYSVRLTEKKYEVAGEKTNYFSYLFLKCAAHLSPKAKLGIVTKAVEAVQKENIEEEKQYEEHMKAKSIICETLEEEGSFEVNEIAEKIFVDSPLMKEQFEEKIEKYNLVKETVKPESEKTKAKYEKQCLLTDTGIEIKIPMEQYKDPGAVEFITNEDGTVSVFIKNIGHLTAKF